MYVNTPSASSSISLEDFTICRNNLLNAYLQLLKPFSTMYTPLLVEDETGKPRLKVKRLVQESKRQSATTRPLLPSWVLP